MSRTVLLNGRRLTPNRSTALATLVAALALLPLLGAKPLTDWDEAIYAEVAREMLHFGALVPHWNYGVWLEKPPLAMWITAALYRVLGVSDFAARACSGLAGVATVSLLHGCLARARGTLAAWLSTGVLLGTFGFLHACHTGEVDTLLAFTCAVGVAGLARVQAAPRSGWLLFWAGFGLAAMTKGAASVVLPLAAAALAVAPPRRLRMTRDFWVGMVVFLGIVLPWHLVMLNRFGDAFVREYLGFHVLARSTHQIEGHATHWWFYVKVLLVAAPPFVLVYPMAVARALGRTGAVDCDFDLRPWAVFALVTLGFYTVVQTRLPQYIVPAYPALAVVTAVYLAGWVERAIAAGRPRGFWLKRGALAVVVSGAMIAVMTPGRKALHSAAPATAGVAAALDNRDSVALLREVRRSSVAAFTETPGPLLLWRSGRISSIATDVFYAGRAVQQVQLEGPGPIPPMEARDRYVFDPVPLDGAAADGPRLILLERALVPLLPASLTYTPMAAHGSVEMGRIAQTQTGRP